MRNKISKRIAKLTYSVVYCDRSKRCSCIVAEDSELKLFLTPLFVDVAFLHAISPSLRVEGTRHGLSTLEG